ncbi:MAG: hypothetical protein AAGE01_06455 [Pseudomonadota bacterium]
MTAIELDHRIGIVRFGRAVDFDTAMGDLLRITANSAFIGSEAFIWDLSKSTITLNTSEMRELAKRLRNAVPPIERPRKVALIAADACTRSLAMIMRALMEKDSQSEYQLFEHERAARTWLLVRKPRTGEQPAVP